MNLAQSISNLYTTFAQYALKRVEGCPHCTSQADDDHLHATTLQTLTPDHLQRFARKAMTTLGDSDDFRHFLPRLLELLSIHGDVGNTEAEVVLGKLEYTHWLDWPANEQDAVRNFLAAWWNHFLSSPPSIIPVGDVLCAIARAEPDLTTYLCSWESSVQTDHSAAIHLSEFVLGELADRPHKPSKLENPFWQERQSQMTQVLAWLLRPKLAQTLEQAFFRASPEDAPLLSQAQQQLAAICERIHSIKQAPSPLIFPLIPP